MQQPHRYQIRESGRIARHGALLLALGAALWLGGPATAGAAPDSAARPTPHYSGNFIVRWRDDTASTTTIAPAAASSSVAASSQSDRMLRIQQSTGVALSVKRQMGGNLQLLSVGERDAADPEATAARLRQDPRIAEVVPDRWLRLHDTTPNDPEFAFNQPYLGTPALATGGVNLPPAWDRTRGNSGLVIAVVDTGYLPHPDLASRIVPGYDFITDPAIANDGDGRDADATDAGDGVPAGFTCPGTSTQTTTATPNSWHGTRVAGTLGALTSNGLNIAGVDWNARIQPVRVSGRCGALLSDTVDGMRWAGGLSVPNAPANPTPARVVNISLGGGTCSSIEQQAVNDLAAKGVVVVAAAGNSAGAVEAPADCAGVVAVTAHANDGENVSYANTGPQVSLSAPGGGCGRSKMSSGSCTVTPSYIRTLSNDGTTSLGNYNVINSEGTSFAAPLVSGVASLMLAVNPALTPAQVLATLESTARPHPAGTYCTASANIGTCGAGLLDANAAVIAAAQVAPAPQPATPAPSSSGGGGGGGALSWPVALGLCALGLLLGLGGRVRQSAKRR
ncbi:S8 family peptidase [Cupriavidus basilensis]|uniref:S8 family peptidase n=1 Tax=Cupriavidus basilensis TaxID=68895 RepID=A0ABT6B2P1_9BURK|nr:S8 family peptidase [Cupriavidus basilensis]MDF3839146.1 S8 family peptidase [Cupriavidus basilensis]